LKPFRFFIFRVAETGTSRNTFFEVPTILLAQFTQAPPYFDGLV
jgi:hypothetical protein